MDMRVRIFVVRIDYTTRESAAGDAQGVLLHFFENLTEAPVYGRPLLAKLQAKTV